MPYALIAIGLLLTIAGARNKQGELFTLVKGDFSGNHSYIWWAVSIIAIGAIGYIKTARPLANMFLALVLVVLILHNSGVFAKFTDAIKGLGGRSNAGDASPNASNDNSNPLAQGASALSGALGAAK